MPNIMSVFNFGHSHFAALDNDIYRVARKRGHFVLRLVTLEVSIRSAPNLVQIDVISFLTQRRK